MVCKPRAPKPKQKQQRRDGGRGKRREREGGEGRRRQGGRGGVRLNCRHAEQGSADLLFVAVSLPPQYVFCDYLLFAVISMWLWRLCFLSISVRLLVAAHVFTIVHSKPVEDAIRKLGIINAPARPFVRK